MGTNPLEHLLIKLGPTQPAECFGHALTVPPPKWLSH
jgi:hypothetical protein